MQTAQPEIFFSYAWGGETEPYALALYESLQKTGYKGVMDRYAVGYKESFAEFMKRIGKGSFIIVLVNDKYLRSDFCMFEFLEIYRKSNSELAEMGAKIFPIVFNDTKLRNLSELLDYADFWENETKQLEAKMTDVGLKSTVDVGSEYKTYSEISANVTLLTKWLRGHNTLSPDKLAENEFAIIKQAIAERAKLLTQQAPDGLPHHLTAPPFRSEVFFGREDELDKMHKNLFEGDNLLLVNGIGGVGKTTLATRYYYSYANEYAHLAWVLSEKSIVNALLLLAVPLGIRFEDTMPTEARLQLLLAKMANLSRPCLLVIDNANELEDLQANYMALRSCPNFHLLLTTRIAQFEKAATFKVGALPYDTALELFTEHYTAHDTAEDELFKKIYEAVDGNTLIIELLAKNLYVQNLVRHYHYPLSELVEDLQKGLLSISKTKPVSAHYHSNTLFKGEPQDIIAAMYDIGELSATEKRLLSILAVLPAENIPFAVLESLLPDTLQLEETLISLSLKGWIEHNQFDAAFKISPVVQEITRMQNDSFIVDFEEIINELCNKLSFYANQLTSNNYTQALLYARYGASVEKVFFAHTANSIATLQKKLGDFCYVTGELQWACYYYSNYNTTRLQFTLTHPTNINYKEELAISHEKLGDIHLAMGNHSLANDCYRSEMELCKQIYESNPKNKYFKQNLAIAYQNLGNSSSDMGKPQQALWFYEQFLYLTKQIYEDNVENIHFKKSLASAYSFVGNAHFDLGNHEQALAFYQHDFNISKELYESNPENIDLKKAFAISNINIGSFYMSLGKDAQYYSFYEHENLLKQELYNNHPDNIGLKKSAAYSYSFQKDFHLANGDLTEAIKAYENYHKLILELYNDYPDNIRFQESLADAYLKLGDLYVIRGYLDEALDSYTHYQNIMLAFCDDYPTNFNFKSSLCETYAKIGDTYLLMQNYIEAIKIYEVYLASTLALFSSDIENANYKNYLADAYKKIGSAYAALEQYDQALPFQEKGIELVSELNNAYPNHLLLGMSLSDSYQKLGIIHGALGNIDSALQFHEKGLQLSKSLVEAHPKALHIKANLALAHLMYGLTYELLDVQKAYDLYSIAESEMVNLMAIAPDFATFEYILELAIALSKELKLKEEK